MVLLYFRLGGRTNHDSDQGHHKSNQIAQLQGVSNAINYLGDIPYIVERISDQRERVGVKSGFAFTLGRLVLGIIMIKHTNEFGHEKGERNGYRRGQSLFAIHSDGHLVSETQMRSVSCNIKSDVGSCRLDKRDAGHS